MYRGGADRAALLEQRMLTACKPVAVLWRFLFCKFGFVCRCRPTGRTQARMPDTTHQSLTCDGGPQMVDGRHQSLEPELDVSHRHGPQT